MEPYAVISRLQRYRRVPRGHSDETALLEAAWLLARRSDASSPGVPVAYYSAELFGRRYPGERRWEDRWETLREAVPLQGARVLELGCNMGLLSTYALQEANAESAFGIDRDRLIIEAARLTAASLGVQPRFATVDLDASEQWESPLLEYAPSVVFALNVLNWVTAKDRLLQFLGHFRCIVVEGHDSSGTEISRLRSVGFSYFDEVATTERFRPLIVARQ